MGSGVSERRVDLKREFDWPDELTGRLLTLTVDLGCVVGSDGLFRELSDGWPELLGHSCDDLLGRPFLDFVCPDDVSRTSDVLMELRRGTEVTRFDNRVVAADGSFRWLSWTAVGLPDEEQHYAVARDLTSQHKAEVDIGDSERRYLDMIESSHDLVQSITPDGHFEFVNRAWHDLLGYSEAELPDLTLYDIVDPVDHDRCRLLFGQLMSGQSIEQIEITFVAKDGRKFPVEGNATGRYRDSEFFAGHSFFRDITERKKAEELSVRYQKQLEQEVAERTSALVQSEKLATLGRLSAGMAHELNNPAAAAQRGAARLRDAITKTQAALLQLDNLAVDADAIPTVARLLERGEERAGRPDTLDALARSDRESDIESWLDQKGIDGSWEIAGSLVSLELTVDDLGGLAANLAADHLPVVLRLISHSHTAFELLEQISHGTRRVSEIVTALKAYSYMDQAPVQDVDIHEALDNTLIMLQGKLTSGVDVERSYGGDVPAIETHGSELNQVWTNLIDNAIDAMEGEGRIDIRTNPDDEWVVVEIEDNGPGIPPEHVDKVFDPFFTTKPPGKGTGLGLNIVYNIVNNQGGDIAVESEPGRTVFRVRIPIERHSEESQDD